jgi:hypothetical protein
MVALALAPCLVAGAAGAVCGRPPAAYVSPEPGAPAPRNAHVRVRLAKDWRAVGICDVDDDGVDRCAAGAFDVTLVRAPGPGVSQAAVPVTRRDLLANEVATVELVPLAPLEARARYEVVLVDRAGGAAARILGTFVTGDATDDTPPAWSGVTRAAFAGKAGVGATGTTIILLPECLSTSIVFYAAEPTDDATPAASIRFAVWMDDGRGVIDYATPPRIFERGRKTVRGFVVEHGGSETEDAFRPPKGRLRARFGVRAVDWAGNMSAPSEVSIAFR